MDHNLPINIIGQISHFFAVNRPLSTLLLIVVLFFGLFSFWLTPKQYNPEIVRPAFAVSLYYEGATVDEAVDRVVFELVEKIRTVPGVDDVYTEVHNGTTINTTVIFEVGYDATKAKLDLLSQIEQHKYLKSGFVSEPQIIEVNPETIPILQIVFGSNELTLPELREKVARLSHELGQVDDVSEVSLSGGYQNSLVVKLDPQKLAAAGVGVNEVVSILESAQLQSLQNGLTSGPYQIEIVLNGQVDTPAEVGLLRIKDEVRVRDVALVYEGVVGDRSYVYHYDNEQVGEVVVLAVSKVEGSSAPIVAGAVLEKLDKTLEQTNFQGLTYEVVGNDGKTASTEIYGLTKNLLTSIVIVAIVLMLFLSTRAALVVLVAIPVTLLIVFGLGFMFDQTINRITLFALILSLGLLVDSAIVVVENIYSHLKEWQSNPSPHSREAVIARAVHEIGIGLLLSAVTSIIVFLPMGYITGMMGPYMGPIAFFVPAALFVSLLVAVIVTPFVASHLIRGEDKKNVINAWFSKQMEKLTHHYGCFLHMILSERKKQRRLLSIALGMFLLTLLLPLFALVHFQMLPKADRDQMYVYIDLPVEANVESTKTFTNEVVKILLKDEDVKNVQAYVGQPAVVDFNGMFKGVQNRTHAYESTLRVNLTSAKDRTRNSTDITSDLRAAVSAAMEDKAEYIRFMEEPPGPPVRATFVAKVTAADQAKQTLTATKLESVVKEVDGVVDVYTTDQVAVGRVVYDIDHEVAANLGVSVDSIRSAFTLLGDSIGVTEFLKTDNIEFTPVVLSVDESQRDTPMAINGLYVTNSQGNLVPLSAVLVVRSEERPARRDLDGVMPVTYVTSEVENRSIVYVMIDIIKLLHKDEIDEWKVVNWNLFSITMSDVNTGEAFEINWGGEWEMTLENFRDLGVAMGVALLLVYAVLVAQYNRFSTPAYILVTVPLGLVGILWGFLVLDTVFGIYLTATALIGFIALIGLVVNNAIIFLEYAEQAQAAGKSFKDSLIAAGEARLRPILLTSLTTVFGSLTIASDPVWSGLAWAIVFGLSLSTVLTLVVYPTLLMYFTGSKENEQTAIY